jgi:hypothetical protein
MAMASLEMPIVVVENVAIVSDDIAGIAPRAAAGSIRASGAGLPGTIPHDLLAASRCAGCRRKGHLLTR